ncbi:MAG: hypothetical protein QOF62_1023 [Pyrinomonadaceae bacterium]|jgi:hypothetical protein|nr:hypothetical protein [Pyrinomonadaceae bacterium]
MNTTTIIISALVGGLVSTISSTAIIWLNKYFDERRHRRELILKTAVESYAQYCQNAKDSGAVGKLLLPFADYVLLMAYLSDKSLDTSVNPSNIDKHLAEVDSMHDKMRDYRERAHKEKMISGRI